MGKPRLIVTRRLPASVEQRAARDFDVLLNATDRVIPQDELLSLCHDADALLCTPTDRIDAAFLSGLPERLKIIATFSAGVDHIDRVEAERRGIVVANTPDVLTDATADIALLLILGACRSAFGAQTVLRQGSWDRWSPTGFVAKDVTGARLGLVGMGRIAQATARRALGFGMRVSYWNRRPLHLPADLDALTMVASLDDLFAGSDIISLHVPGAPETTSLVDARRLALMPKGAVLVNTARGTLVDDDALIAALAEGQLFAAGLDVFKNEPAFDRRYLDLPNVYLLPHIGSATERTRDAMGMLALDEIEACFKSATLQAAVNG
jgi:lactate dehydrogenase-like 2-hydroxyacid dehydrogenase